MSELENITYVIGLVLMILGVFGAVVFYYIHTTNVVNKEKEKAYQQGLAAGKSAYRPTMSFEEVNKVLVTIINDALTQKQKLVYDLQDMVMYDFNKEVEDLSKDVIFSLSDEFKREFCYYQTKEFLKKHIIDYCIVLLLDDLSKRKPPVGSQAMRNSSSVIRA